MTVLNEEALRGMLRRYGVLYDPVWDSFTYPEPLYPSSRYEIIRYRYPEPEPCPGKGVCHGCLSWCAWCGDVQKVCNAEWPHCCDTHKRYPEQPEHLKPNPNQLLLPGICGV